MQKALHPRTTMLSEGKVEIASPELEAGQTVDVVVLRESNVKGHLRTASLVSQACSRNLG